MNSGDWGRVTPRRYPVCKRCKEKPLAWTKLWGGDFHPPKLQDKFCNTALGRLGFKSKQPQMGPSFFRPLPSVPVLIDSHIVTWILAQGSTPFLTR